MVVVMVFVLLFLDLVEFFLGGNWGWGKLFYVFISFCGGNYYFYLVEKEIGI